MALLALCAITAPGVAFAQVAKVLRVEGAAILERAGQPRRILGVGEPLEQKDVISVAGDSHAMLEFRDETRITLRPNTVFRLDTYTDLSPESMFLGLVKGGMRAVTGLIGKRNPSAVRIEAVTATIGIRGTEFDARLCENDCAAEERARPAPRIGRNVAARVIEMNGMAAAALTGSPSRLLVPGAGIYEREGIATGPGSYAVIAFRDASVITLAGDTVVSIEQFRYDRARPEQSSAALKFSQGGLRVLTGLGAKGNPGAYRIDTAVGKIEAGESGFDAACGGACAETAIAARDAVARLKAEADRLAAQAKAPAEKADEAAQKIRPALPGDGLTVHAWSGTVVLGTGAEPFDVKENETAGVASLGGKPAPKPAPPSYMLDSKLPRPDTVRIDPAVFGPSTPDYEQGLYIWVRDGTIRLAQEAATRLGGSWQIIRTASVSSSCPQTLDVTAGNAAVATGDCLSTLDTVPNFMRFDATPVPEPGGGSFVPAFFRATDGAIVGMCTGS